MQKTYTTDKIYVQSTKNVQRTAHVQHIKHRICTKYAQTTCKHMYMMHFSCALF